MESALSSVWSRDSGVTALHHFFILFVPYIAILASLSNQTPKEGHKTLSTYRSHITVVILFFGPCTFTHATSSLPEDKVMALFDAFITPMLNLPIYALRMSKKCHGKAVE